MTASVVIPTRDRHTSLLPLLERVLPQAAACAAEVVVVDNGSSDGTPEALRSLSADGRLRVVVEPLAGATRARNTGARAASGHVVAFIDDDALPRDGWLEALLGAFVFPGIGAAGGRVVLRFAGDPPGWWDAALAAYLAAYDLGPEPLDLGTRPWYDSPRGLNLAVRREALLAVGGFDTRLGPRAGRPSVGEESDLCLRLLARGRALRYVPGAVVEQVVDPRRLEPGWFLRRAFWTGWSEAMIDLTHRRWRSIAGRVRWHYGRRALRLPHAAGSEPHPARLSAECARREAWGYLLGVARHGALRRRLARAQAVV